MQTAIILEVLRHLIVTLYRAGLLDQLIDDAASWAKQSTTKWDDVCVDIARDILHKIGEGKA